MNWCRRLLLCVLIIILLFAVFPSNCESYAWNCPQCGRTGNTGNYCGGCAYPAPWLETDPEPKSGKQSIKVGDCEDVDEVNSKGVSLDQVMPASSKLDILSEEEIAEIAYILEDGDKLAAPTALTGKVTIVLTPWNEEYKNITVCIDVAGKQIQCYRLTGKGAESLAEGDVITVTGILKNYKGTIEFDKGCTFTK